MEGVCPTEWGNSPTKNGPTLGHYRAFDVDFTDGRVWIADDAVPTCLAGDPELKLIKHNCYLLVYGRLHSAMQAGMACTADDYRIHELMLNSDSRSGQKLPQACCSRALACLESVLRSWLRQRLTVMYSRAWRWYLYFCSGCVCLVEFDVRP